MKTEINEKDKTITLDRQAAAAFVKKVEDLKDAVKPEIVAICKIIRSQLKDERVTHIVLDGSRKKKRKSKIRNRK